MKADLDIIILSLNNRKLLEICLNSIYNQTLLPKTITVVDNGSKDDTSKLIKTNYPLIRLITLKRNLGIPIAFNKALKKCNSKFIAWLNDDIVLEENWIKIIYEFIKNKKKVASCDSLIMYQDNKNIIWSMGADFTLMGNWRFINQGKLVSDFKNNIEKKNIATVGCAAIYRRSIFDEIGYLDENFFFSYEDVDWSLRATLAGYENYNVPSARVYHKVSQTSVIGSDKYVRNGQRNVTAVFLKNTPWELIFILIPFHLIYQFFSFIYYFFQGRGFAWIRAKNDNLILFSKYLKDRKKIQKSRKISLLSYIKLLSINFSSNKFTFKNLMKIIF